MLKNGRSALLGVKGAERVGHLRYYDVNVTRMDCAFTCRQCLQAALLGLASSAGPGQRQVHRSTWYLPWFMCNEGIQRPRLNTLRPSSVYSQLVGAIFKTTASVASVMATTAAGAVTLPAAGSACEAKAGTGTGLQPAMKGAFVQCRCCRTRAPAADQTQVLQRCK